jgi:pyruvate-formate lyase-activating enzyme
MNVEAIAEYVRDINNCPIELMNFNPLAINKYKLLGLDCGSLEGTRPLAESIINELYDTIEAAGCIALRSKS